MIGGGIFNFPLFVYDSSAVVDVVADFCLKGITQTLYKINGSAIVEIKLNAVINQECNNGC